MTVTSVHVLRYDEHRGWPEVRGARPEAARYWHPGIFAKRDSSSIPIPDEREWTVLATWADADAGPLGREGRGPGAGARESWWCLLSPTPPRVLPAEPLWADGTTTPPFGAVMVEEPI